MHLLRLASHLADMAPTQAARQEVDLDDGRGTALVYEFAVPLRCAPCLELTVAQGK